MEIITGEDELQRVGFYWRSGAHGVRALVCQLLEQDGFVNGFSTRLGGTSPMPQGALNLAGFDHDTADHIHENRQRFLKLFAGDWTLITAWQVHGSETCVVKDAVDMHRDTKRCDALTTQQANVLLGIKTADCVPVLLGDRHTRAIAAIHAGWRGTAASIVKGALGRMQEEFGTQSKDVRAVIGPAARMCCYEVGAEVIEAFRKQSPGAEHLFDPTRDGHACIDLQRANKDQLINAGVPAEHIHIAPLCTMCRTDLFFSYRRESGGPHPVGRLLAVIGRQEIRRKDEG